MLTLNEDLFDDIIEIDVPNVEVEIPADDIVPEGPQQGIDTGIANEILSLLNDENEAIQGYNNFKANLQGHEDFAKIIDDIANEEMNHIGMLQSLLKKVSPNTETIEAGKEEAEQELTEDLDMLDECDNPNCQCIDCPDDCHCQETGNIAIPDEYIDEKWSSRGYEDDLELALEDPGDFPDDSDEDIDDEWMYKYMED